MYVGIMTVNIKRMEHARYAVSHVAEEESNDNMVRSYRDGLTADC